MNYDSIKSANFTFTDASATTVSPDQNILVSYTYKNTWGSAYDFKVVTDLEDDTETDIFRLASGTSYTRDNVLQAPSAEGNYNIDLDGYVELSSGHWTSGDGSANIPITVINPDVTINSNVDTVVVTYSGQDYAIDASKTVTIPNVGVGTKSFTATKDGYNAVNFNVVTSTGDETYELTMTESSASLIINSNVADIGLSYGVETATIDVSKTIEISDLEVGQNYDFTATKTGYVDNTFSIDMIEGGLTHELTMIEESSPTLTFTSNVPDVDVSYQNGDYTIVGTESLIIEDVPTGQTFEFVATKDGYQTNTFDIIIDSEDVIHAITMEEIAEETINVGGGGGTEDTTNIEATIKILNEDVPIENAKVFINGITKYTDENGDAVFSLPINIYTVTVTHDEYKMVSKEYEVNSNSNEIIILLGDKNVTENLVSFDVDLNSNENNAYIVYGFGILFVCGLGYFLHKRK